MFVNVNCTCIYFCIDNSDFYRDIFISYCNVKKIIYGVENNEN